MGLSAWAEWILIFVQEIAGVSTDPEGSWATKHILFLSFLVCDAKTGLPKKKKTEKKCSGHGTVCMDWMDLKLCARDSWCTYRPTRELVHQAIKTLKIVNTLPVVSFYVLLMLGFKIQCKNITFRAVSGNKKNIARKRRICLDLCGCEKDSPCFSTLGHLWQLLLRLIKWKKDKRLRSTRKISYYCTTPVYLLKTYHKDRSINIIKYVISDEWASE